MHNEYWEGMASGLIAAADSASLHTNSMANLAYRQAKEGRVFGADLNTVAQTIRRLEETIDTLRKIEDSQRSSPALRVVAS